MVTSFGRYSRMKLGGSSSQIQLCFDCIILLAKRCATWLVGLLQCSIVTSWSHCKLKCTYHKCKWVNKREKIPRNKILSLISFNIIFINRFLLPNVEPENGYVLCHIIAGGGEHPCLYNFMSHMVLSYVYLLHTILFTKYPNSRKNGYQYEPS